MKKFVFYTTIICLSVFCVAAFSKHFWKGETLESVEVAKLWGKNQFDAPKFRNGDEKTRSAMAWSVLERKKDFIGKKRQEIWEMLGNPDGFYFTDMFPAYMIKTAMKKGESSWQIVFILDNKGFVNDVIVHKNCCD